MKRPPRRGFSLLEVMVAFSLSAVVILAIGGFIVSSYRSAGSEKDRAFAMQRAMQMMEEISAYQKTSGADVGISKFNQGATTYSFQLTTADSAVASGSYSGNPKKFSDYKYVRHVSVAAVPSDPQTMQVTVEVYYAKAGTTPTPDPKRPRPLAVVSNHLRVAPGAAGAMQVLDVYVISIENIPHIFRDAANKYYSPSATDARLAFSQSMRNFMSNNPSIVLRPHFITRLSKGRDPYYRPYVNEGNGAVTATRDPINWVYWYPGKLDSASDGTHYYDPTNIAGNINVGDTSNAPSTKTGSYPLADYFNHPVQYAREYDFSGTSATDKWGEPQTPAGVQTSDTQSGLSLRQFLEDLLQDDTGKYRNAIVVNLHGELFPCLALRPYADAAKDPYTTDTTLRKRRLVTHPYRLNFPDTGDDSKPPARLLVYPYMDDGSDCPQESSDSNRLDNVLLDNPFANHDWSQSARIIIRNVKPDLNYGAASGGVTVSFVQRERKDGLPHSEGSIPLSILDSGGDDAHYVTFQAWPLLGTSDDEQDPTRKYHSGPHLEGSHKLLPSASDYPHFVGNDLYIDLKDVDYDAHAISEDGSKYGIDHTDAQQLLHGLQYFPDPYLTFLDSDGDKQPRNTARVMIDLDMANSAKHKRYQVDTMLMTSSGYASSPLTSDDPTVSHTYFYVGEAFDSTNTNLYYGTTTSSYKPTIPWTDQVQLVGDPRHCPYADLREHGNVNPFWTNFTAGNMMYKNVDSTGSHKVDFGNGDANIPGATATTTGKGKGKGKSKPTSSFPDISLPDSHDSWNTTKYNGPAYFRMWREALYRNNMVMVNVSGEPVSYIGMGGEFSLKDTINGIGNPLQFISSIYKTTSGAVVENGRSELDDEVPFIQDASAWVAKSWIGELYPMSAWSDWNTTGNLRTSLYTHENLSSIHGPWDAFADKASGNNTKHLANDVGMSSFLNVGVTLTDQTPGNQGTTITSLGTSVQSAFNEVLSKTLQAEYGYKLATPSATTTEWGDSLYSSHREIAEFLNSSFGLSGAGYVNHTKLGYSVNNPILLEDTSIMTTRRMVFVANAARAGSVGQLNDVFDWSVTGMVQSFFDLTRDASGKTLGAYDAKPLPRVLMTSPSVGAILTGGTANVTWQQAFERADNKPYSTLFTYDDAAGAASGGPLPIVYFLKYKSLSVGGNWQMAKITTTPAVSVGTWVPSLPTDPDPYDAGTVPPQPTVPKQPDGTTSVTWNYSALSAGDYLLRLEAYRLDGSGNVSPTHYAYHEVHVTLN